MCTRLLLKKWRREGGFGITQTMIAASVYDFDMCFCMSDTSLRL
jgi:hypothetical protein